MNMVRIMRTHIFQSDLEYVPVEFGFLFYLSLVGEVLRLPDQEHDLDPLQDCLVTGPGTPE